MTAEEIRKELDKNAVEMFPVCSKIGIPERMLQLLQYSAQMEIAAQLAELNTRLGDVIGSRDGLDTVRVAALVSESKNG